MSFNDLGLRPELLRAVADQGYTLPTPVQSKAIPVVLSGGDLMAAAQTGTGKTAGFTLPLLQRLSTTPRDPSTRRGSAARPRALVVVPTRELALQVHESVCTYGKYLQIRSTVIFGGVGMTPQLDALRGGVDIVVATPGRLLDHVGQRSLDLSGIEHLVLDEADRMLDMGFIHDIKKILALVPPKKQSLLFSATFSDDIRQLAMGLLKSPTIVEVARRNAPAEAVAQSIYRVDRDKKKDLLVQLIRDERWHQVLVFTRTKHGADALAKRLHKAGIRAAALHGNKSQGQRQRALEEFKQVKVNVLVATDIAARGLDIDELPQVVNYELPHVPEDYVHRIGRTGRAGASGKAVSLVCEDEREQLRDIERLLKRELEKKVLPGFEPSGRPPQSPSPAQPQRRGGHAHRDVRPARANGARGGHGRPAQATAASASAPSTNEAPVRRLGYGSAPDVGGAQPKSRGNVRVFRPRAR